MQHCDLCKVDVAGYKRACPLCGGTLTGEPEPDSEVFPKPYKARLSAHFILYLLAFVAIAASAVCVIINIATNNSVWWSLLVVFGSACAWATAATAIAHRRDLTQNIVWQVILLSTLSFFWDRGIGWHGWSIDFVLPCACAAALCTIPLLALILRLPIRSFSGPLTLCSIIGLIPAVLMMCGKIRIVLPSIICAGLAIIVLTALLLFCWNVVKEELNRRFHV